MLGGELIFGQEGIMSRLQLQGAKQSSKINASEDYDEKEWQSDKGKSVMRFPPWTKTDSRAKEHDPKSAQIIAASNLDYDAEESFERPVTMATSPDPWATGDISIFGSNRYIIIKLVKGMLLFLVKRAILVFLFFNIEFERNLQLFKEARFKTFVARKNKLGMYSCRVLQDA